MFSKENIWTKEETNFIKKNYKELTAREISVKINRSIHSIKHKRRKLNLFKGPAYRWNEEKVIKKFLEIKKELRKTPTYNNCKKYGGLLDAIHRIYGKYSNFLKLIDEKPNQKSWNKEKCLKEFSKIHDKVKKVPTMEDIKKCKGLRKAILNRWRTYNRFLKELNLKPNFELKWDKNKIKEEYDLIMGARKHIPTIEELKLENPALLAAIYNYFKSYNDLIHELNYMPNYDYTWLEWQKLVSKICKNLYKVVLIQPTLKNSKRPDVAINPKKEKFYLIVDAKLNHYSYSIKKDTINYKPFCEKLQFWCLSGSRKVKEKNVEILSSDKIISLLNDKKLLELEKEVKNFVKCYS